jgi:hypothetical protein
MVESLEYKREIEMYIAKCGKMPIARQPSKSSQLQKHELCLKLHFILTPKITGPFW